MNSNVSRGTLLGVFMVSCCSIASGADTHNSDAAPKKKTTFIKNKKSSPEELRQLLRDLGNEVFMVRHRASERLKALAPQLRVNDVLRPLGKTDDLEVRVRLHRLWLSAEFRITIVEEGIAEARKFLGLKFVSKDVVVAGRDQPDMKAAERALKKTQMLMPEHERTLFLADFYLDAAKDLKADHDKRPDRIKLGVVSACISKGLENFGIHLEKHGLSPEVSKRHTDAQMLQEEVCEIESEDLKNDPAWRIWFPCEIGCPGRF